MNAKKKPCPDCRECQMCAESRCRACRKGGHCGEAAELGPALTFGQYLAWRDARKTARFVPENGEGQEDRGGS